VHILFTSRQKTDISVAEEGQWNCEALPALIAQLRLYSDSYRLTLPLAVEDQAVAGWGSSWRYGVSRASA